MATSRGAPTGASLLVIYTEPSDVMMRLVFVVDSFMVGGSELAALRTFRLLRDQATISVVHFHPDGPLLAEYRAMDADMHHVPLYSMRDPRNLISVYGLRRTIAALAPHVVHAHDAYSNMLLLAVSSLGSQWGWISSRRWLDQIVRPVHARLNDLAFRRSAAVTVNSEAVAAHMVTRENVPAHKIVVIPNFVDVPVVTTAPAEADERAPVTIGMVSRLTPIKRHDVALRALRILRDGGLAPRLVIVGDGIAREQIENLAAELGLAEQVLLVGERHGGAKLHIEFDISLATSDSEGSPNSVLEAMAAGRPVVATDVGGTRDLIRHGENGLLVPRRDPEAVATALRSLILNPSSRSRLATAGRKTAIDHYSPAVIEAKLLTLYERVARGRVE